MPKGKKNALLITSEKCRKAGLDFSAQLFKSVECEAPRRRWVNTLWHKHHILSVERQQCDAHKMRNAGADNTDMLAGHTFSPFPAALTPAHTLTVRPDPDPPPHAAERPYNCSIVFLMDDPEALAKKHPRMYFVCILHGNHCQTLMLQTHNKKRRLCSRHDKRRYCYSRRALPPATTTKKNKSGARLHEEAGWALLLPPPPHCFRQIKQGIQKIQQRSAPFSRV